jgi:Raf kinase inhibitor-like YbhB/YbcL family protein
MGGKHVFLLLLAAAALAVSGCVSEGYRKVDQMGNLTLSSPAFRDREDIPAKHTCQGDDTSPGLRIGGVPEGARSLVLIVDDPDAPMGTFDHWVVWDIPAGTASIPEDSVPQGAVQGRNGAGTNQYVGPCPPSGKHRYFFKLYALDTSLGLGGSSGKADVERAMEGHVLARAQLVGLYQKA